MNRFFIYTIVLVLLVSCGYSQEEKERLSREERRRLQIEDSLALKICVLPTLDCLPMFVAKERGWFAVDREDIRLKPYNAQMDCDVVLEKGLVEGSISDLIRTERLITKGLPLTYISSTNTYWQLIANKMARVKKLGQLGDKMVAMTRFSATDYLTDRTLEGVKTKAQVFRIQINDVTLRLKMLLNNEMDALWLPEPQATMARQHSNPVLRDSRDYKVNLGVLAFRSNAMRDKRRQKQLRAFVKAYNEAVDSINRLGLDHYSIIIQKYCGVDENTIKAIPKTMFRHVEKPSGADINLARQYVKALKSV